MGSGLVLGGLLQGLGAGITRQHEERRQAALAQLAHEYDLEEKRITADAARDVANTNAASRKEVIELTGDQNRKTEEVKGKQRLEEIREKGKVDKDIETVKFSNEKELKRLGANLDAANDRASQLLKAEIDGGQVDQIDAAEDGSMLVTYKNGSVVKKNVKLREKGSSEDDGISISGERAARDGGGDEAPAEQKPKWSPQDENQLRTRYANATPETAPRLFRNGKKLPLEEVRRLMQGL